MHADATAAERARRRGAIAFTTGRHIHLGKDTYRPHTKQGNWILAHEATHAVQQGLADVRESDLPTLHHAAAEAEADGIASGRSTRVRSLLPPAAMPLTAAQFQAQLGSSAQQGLAIDTLFANTTFRDVWDWIGACAAMPAQDHGPIELLVTPGLTSGGIVRFGGYFLRTLEINPTKPEHLNNPAELVDTVFHETIHAADDVDGACQAAGSPAAPLAGAATSILPSRASVAGTLAETVANVVQGPGASDPCGEFIDINDAAQTMVTTAIQSNIQTTAMGHPTLTFVNMIIRSDLAALSSYETCRVAACALSGSARTGALGDCSSETIAEFLPSSMLSALLPAHLHFASGSSSVLAEDVSKLQLVARYLVHHPAQTVRLVGHADPTGLASANQTLGQQRANTVQSDLSSAGVPAGQIASATSLGATSTLSTSTSQRFRDRRVEILP